MRLAILFSFVPALLGLSAARAESPFIPVSLESQTGYIVPAAYVQDHRAEFMASLPESIKISGFWTPSLVNAAVAERVFRETIEAAVKNPALLFPDFAKAKDVDSLDALKKEQAELEQVSENYDHYTRQYVGIVVGGTKLVFCNYSDAPKADPATDYIFIQKFFATDGSARFLQCRFNPIAKVCSNVSIIGSWQKAKEE